MEHRDFADGLWCAGERWREARVRLSRNRSGIKGTAFRSIGNNDEKSGELGRRKKRKYYKIKGVVAGDRYLSESLREVVTADSNSVWL